MKSYESMKSKLEKTGLYKISSKTNVNAELLAFSQGLDILFDMLEQMEKERYITTAEDYGITRRENFSGGERINYSLEKRREMLLIASKTTAGGSSVSDFEQVMKGYGVTSFSFVETPAQSKLTIQIKDILTAEEKKFIRERVELDFPSHLEITISFA